MHSPDHSKEESQTMKRLSVVFLIALMIVASVAPVVSGAGTARLYTIVLKESVAASAAADVVAKAGGLVVDTVPEVGGVQAQGGDAFLGKVLADTRVQAAGPSIVMSLKVPKAEAFQDTEVNIAAADLYNTYQWDIKRVTNNGASYDLGTGSHGVVVAVVDTGINGAHPALVKNFLGGRNFVPAGAFGDTTETGDPNDYMDRYGHGSHVAGTIGGNGRILGVAPDVGLRAYRVLAANGSGYSEWIAKGMVAAANDGAAVINMSLGGYDVMGQVFWTDPATGKAYNLGHDVADFLLYRRAVQYAAAHGTLVVASAGNDGLNMADKTNATELLNEEYGEFGYTFVGATFKAPAGVAGVITVSATGPDDSVSSYSDYGVGYVNVAAPGGDFKRYPVGDWYTDMCLSAYKTSGYAWMAGTSMAAPKVSAVAALVKAAHPEYNVSQVAAAVSRSAEDLGRVGTDQLFGDGLVNAYNALAK